MGSEFSNFEFKSNLVSEDEGNQLKLFSCDEIFEKNYVEIHSSLYPLANLLCHNKEEYIVMRNEMMDLNKCKWHKPNESVNFVPYIQSPNTLIATEVFVKVAIHSSDVNAYIRLTEQNVPNQLDTTVLKSFLKEKDVLFETKGSLRCLVDFRSETSLHYLWVRLVVNKILYTESEYTYNLDHAKVDDRTKFVFYTKDRVLNLTGSDVSATARRPPVSREEFVTKISESLAGQTETIGRIYDQFILPRDQTVSKRVKDLNIALEPGFLLVGPPGTGKSRLAELIGKTMYGKFLFLQGPEIKSKYVGDTEKSIRQIFKVAADDLKENGIFANLHVVCFDEIDAVLPRRSADSSNHGNSMTAQFLSCLTNEFPSNLIVIGTTNFERSIDPAALRSGRLGTKFFIGMPDEAQRTQIFKLYLGKIADDIKEFSDDDDIFAQLSARSAGLTGADMQSCIDKAKMEFLTVGGTKEKLTFDDLAKQIALKKDQLNINFEFVVWCDELARFIDSAIDMFTRMSKGNVMSLDIVGDGAFALGMFLSKTLNVNFLQAVVRDTKDIDATEDAIVFFTPKGNFSDLQYLELYKYKFKLANMKLMFLNKLESATAAAEASTFILPKVTCREFREICEQKGLSLDRFDLPDLNDSEKRSFSTFFKFRKL